MSIYKLIKSWFRITEKSNELSNKSNIDEIKKRLNISHNRLILNANDFLDNRVVFYFERNNHPVINKYISKNFKKLLDSFKSKGLSFIHIPSTEFFNNDTDSRHELIEYLYYKHPDIFTISENQLAETVKTVIENIDLQLYYNTVGDNLGIPDDQGPCFIHSVDLTIENNEYRKWEYSCFYLNTSNESLLANQIEFYLAHTGIPTDQIFFSLKREDKLNYNADEQFEIDGSKISSEINNAIQQIKSITNEKLLITSILYLFESLKNSNPIVCEKISKVIQKRIESISPQPSRLIIDEQFRIWLPDYNHIEIEMTPLPKTFYLFMLRHPEGISFKHLSEYKDELLEIYSKIGNRYELEKIKQSINDIADIRSNSVNEKCSRIKEAFLLKIDESIAQNYYITGGRNQLKKIILDSSLIQFPKSL